ncbi:immunoglobulin superfamily member 5 [Discoglossus pictus]
MNNSTDSITRRFTSQMSLIKVTKDNSGEIGCSFVGTSPQNAYLSVQVNGSLQITNGSITTLPNKTIDIFCKAAGWYPDPVITWQINNTFLNTLDYVTSYTPGNNGLQDAVSILTIHTQDNVSISCLASIESLAAPQSTSVNLIVTEYPPVPAPKNNTETIIIAVTVTIGVLLLIVIIIVIVVCCWKKKQTDTSYQSEAWKMSSKSAGDISNSGKSFTGERNAGYIPETPPKRRSLPRIPSHTSSSDNIYIRKPGDTFDDAVFTSQVPAHVNPGQIKKTRHLTHV